MKGFQIMFVAAIFLETNASMDSSFTEGVQHATNMTKGIEDNIKSGKDQSEIPQFQGAINIGEDELGKAREHLKNHEYGKDLEEIHNTRKIYIVDDTDPVIVRSESINRNPKTELEETEEIIESKNGETIEYCEECPDEEYLVTATRTKTNLIYMTASKRCTKPGNHGTLTIKIELTEIEEGLLKKGGPFENIEFVNKHKDGPYIHEKYKVDGYEVTLKKTIQQENQPGVRSGCYLARDLEEYVLNPKDLINNLLGLNKKSNVSWGDIGNARLNLVGDRFYFVYEGRASDYEKLVQQGLCRYASIEEISKTDRNTTEKLTYACRLNCKDTCKMLKARGCSREVDPECLEKIEDKCIRWRWKFRCKDRVGVKKHKFSGKNAFCLGGDCIDSSYESDKDMVSALSYLSILEAARKDMENGMDIFRGNPMTCTRHCLNFTDCCSCGSKGWGVSTGLTNCSSEEKILAQLRDEKKCVQVGTYCVEKEPITKTCIRKKTVFCCFGSKFAKLLQEQGKQQLGQNFGTPESPNCRGFTADELGQIDFSILDLSEIVDDVVDNFRTPPQEHFAEGMELEHIREQVQKKVKEQSGTERESVYLKENLKHMTSSMKGSN